LTAITELLAPVVTFVAGTLTPSLVARFSFEGIAIGQITDYITFSGEKNGLVVFATIVKFANATKASVILAGIECPPLVLPSGTGYYPVRVELQRCIAGAIQLPPTGGPTQLLDYPPVIIAPGEDTLVAIALRFVARPSGGSEDVSDLQQALAQGYRIQLRVNGKRRDYLLHLRASNLARAAESERRRRDIRSWRRGVSLNSDPPSRIE